MFTLIGITDERDHCEMCGKVDLKRVMVLKDDDGQFKFVGTTCGARALEWGVKETKKAAKKAQDKAKKAARFQFNKHPQIVKRNMEIAEANRKGIPFGERPIARWKTMEQEAKTEVLKRFPTVATIS